MHLRLIAVGDRQPAWVDDAVAIYSNRFPPQWRFRIDRIPAVRRSKNTTAGKARQTETGQILARVTSSERLVLLDEKGSSMSSAQLATRINDWQTDGRDLCFVIGGPDGVDDACRARADTIWSLSALTLPHGLARVLLVEQLYRAWSLSTGHPYHRE